MIKNNELKWIGVDWDGVVADTIEPDYKIGNPLPGSIEALKELNRRGWKLVIYTARHWSNWVEIEDKCKEWGIEIKTIICGKPLVRWMIDDRNVEFNGDWEKVLDKIGHFNEEVDI